MRRPILTIFLIGVLAFGAVFLAAPWFAFRALRSAAKANDIQRYARIGCYQRAEPVPSGPGSRTLSAVASTRRPGIAMRRCRIMQTEQAAFLGTLERGLGFLHSGPWWPRSRLDAPARSDR